MCETLIHPRAVLVLENVESLIQSAHHYFKTRCYSKTWSNVFQSRSFFTRQPVPISSWTHPVSSARAMLSSLSSVVAKRINNSRACAHPMLSGFSRSLCSCAPAGTCVMSSLGLFASIERSLQGGRHGMFLELFVSCGVCSEELSYMLRLGCAALLGLVVLHSVFRVLALRTESLTNHTSVPFNMSRQSVPGSPVARHFVWGFASTVMATHC